MRQCLSILIVLLLLTAASVTGEVQRSDKSKDGGLYPQGDKFCFTFYSTKPDDSVYVLKHGATAIGPYYGNQSADLARSAEYKTAFVYKVNLPCMSGKSFLKDDFVMPSEETIISETAAVIKAVRDNKQIAYWDIVPEELRYWRKNEMRYMELVTSTIRANDPLSRPVYMYEPCHRNADALAKTIIYQDICAKGMYVEEVKMTDSRIWCRWSMEQELKAIEMANPKAKPWIVLWMAWDAKEDNKQIIVDRCRHDAYMGLIMGGKGIQIWSGWRGRKGFKKDFDAYLDAYLSVADDLNGDKGLGSVFLFGTKNENTTMNITSGPETLTLDYQKKIHEYPSVTFNVINYKGKTYLFVVNSANEKVTAVFDRLPNENAKSLFGGNSICPVDNKLFVTMKPLEVKGFVFDNSVKPALK